MKLTCVSLNIWEGGHLFDEVVAFLKETNPDILALQEVYDGKNPSFERRLRCMDELRKILQFPYDVIEYSFLDTRDVGDVPQGNALFSKFPITSSKAVFFDTPYGPFDDTNATDFQYQPMSMQLAEITFNGFSLQIGNAHGIWGLDGGDTERRLAMSDTILAALQENKNTMLLGDFNVKPNTDTIGKIEKRFKNVFKDQLTTTFNMKRKTNPGYATAVVDMMFVSEGIGILSHVCPQVDISDHLPLIAKIAIEHE